MLIESSISENFLNVRAVYSLAPGKILFPTLVLFTMGWDRPVCICLLWYFIVVTRRVPRVLTDI